MAYSVGFVSLGCAKNQINTEQMLYLLQEAGYELRGEPDGVDLVVVNTCGFIDAAKSEAIEVILTLGQRKAQGRVGRLLVTGCLSQRYQDEILSEMPEVDGILGTGSYHDIVEAADRVLSGEQVRMFGDIHAAQPEPRRVLTTPPYYAYLRIAEGCDNHCAYCVIPKLRGRYRSRPMGELLEEAEGLAASGVKELIVIAQDTSRYGLDLYGEHRLAPLLRALCRIEGFRWVRVHYLYPDELPDELIDTIAREPKIVKYLDIPIQHVNDQILKRMNRRGDHAYLDGLFTRLRARIPGLVLRTSLIAGLPGEDEAAFEELCAFLRRHRLERVGAFVFSPEEGTAAARMEYPPQEVAERRTAFLEDLASRIIDGYNDRRAGQLETVLCEGYDGERGAYFGRSYAESPDIDGKIWFTAPRAVAPGTFVTVRLGEALDGEPVGVVFEEGASI